VHRDLGVGEVSPATRARTANRFPRTRSRNSSSPDRTTASSVGAGRASTTESDFTPKTLEIASSACAAFGPSSFSSTKKRLHSRLSAYEAPARRSAASRLWARSRWKRARVPLALVAISPENRIRTSMAPAL